MGYSIQEHLKKINSNLTLTDCLSLLVTTIILSAFVGYLYIEKSKTNIPVSYVKDTNQKVEVKIINNNTRPFASINGKTYTFSWCQGANVITDKNKIYFRTENEAQDSGRTLSKLCQK